MSWSEVLKPVLHSQKMQEIRAFLTEERKTKAIYPSGKAVFRAFDLCPYKDTRVVILGQDPYHTPDTADGLAFSTQQEKRPPSLEVIFKEVYTDLNIQYFHNETYEEFFPSNDLTSWAKLGILLLNTVLTVEEGKPNSHKDLGWNHVIEQVFDGLNKKDHQVVFLLWGSEAKKYAELVTNKKHIIFEAAHPAAELYAKTGKAGFYGCRHFSIIRDILPGIDGKDIFPRVKLESCFDKEKAKKIAREHYPIDAEKICKYIDEELFINVPVNKDIYVKITKQFEKSLSTKKPEDDE